MNETDSTGPGVRPDPSKHWDDADRLRVLSVIQQFPDHDGLWHMEQLTLRLRKSHGQAGDGMALDQFEREGLLTYAGNVWNLTPAGHEFVEKSLR